MTDAESCIHELQKWQIEDAAFRGTQHACKKCGAFIRLRWVTDVEEAENQSLRDRLAQVERAISAVGLPAGSSIQTLIDHHRANAALAAGFDVVAAENRAEAAERYKALADEAYFMVEMYAHETGNSKEREEAARMRDDWLARYDALQREDEEAMMRKP